MDDPTHLTPDTVLLKPKVSDRDTLVELMLERLAASHGLTHQAELSVDSIIESLRERAPTTPFVEGGFACPHVRLEGFDGLALCFAVLDEPIQWTPDTEPVDLVTMLVAPANRPTVCLQVLAQLARLAQDVEGRAYMKSQTSATQLCGWLKPRLFEDVLVIAQDIMRLPLGTIEQDTRISDLTIRMAHYNLDAVGIQDSTGKLIGEITADRLFTQGMPAFFQQLKSVSFIAEFDPFEAYFEDSAPKLAKDVMTTDFSALPPTATLLEVVFELAVKKHPKVYVVDEDHILLGVIDRIRVIDRILNV